MERQPGEVVARTHPEAFPVSLTPAGLMLSTHLPHLWHALVCAYPLVVSEHNPSALCTAILPEETKEQEGRKY